MKKKIEQSNIISFIIGGISFSLLTYLGIQHSFNGTQPKGTDAFSELAECREIIEEKGVSGFDDEAAMNGYLSEGLDKYTYIIKDGESNEEQSMMDYVNKSGTAVASGFQIRKSDNGTILLIEVQSGKAAYKSGLREGDEVISINGTDVKNAGFENIANKLMGKQNTEAELIVLREGKEQSVTFKRDNISIKDIEGEVINNIGYIKISGWGTFADGNMNAFLHDSESCKGYVIDLRNNEGGDIDTCCELLSYFTPGTSVVMHYEKQEVEEKIIENGNTVVDKPIVLLVNGKTASAAEIFTSAVKQGNKDSTIVGEHTYGKGIFQTITKLESGDHLSYTSGYFTVGDWECWQGKGIDPDIEVEMDPSLIGTDDDVQLKKALDLLD